MPIGASRQVGHFFNAIRHHDGCRLLHPAKWDIGQFRGAFVTDADWCIPSGGSFCISFNLRCQELTDSFTIQFIIHIHSIFKYHISISYSLSYRLFKDILNLCTHSHTHSCTHSHTHSYTHSCTYFIYSFTYSFMYLSHILIHILILILIHVLISYLLGKLPKYFK